MKDIPIESVKKAISYIPETGEFLWKHRDPIDFKSKRAYSIHESKRAGKSAGYINPSLGYLVIHLNHTLFYAHRVAWAIYYGSQPSGFIDHINGDRSDNRIENLRVTDRRGNAINRGMLSSNTSGHTGVYWSKRERKWQATIKDQSGVARHLGYFVNIDDAARIRRDAQSCLGYHPGHGERQIFIRQS